MALVHIPAALRTLTGGETSVTIPGETLREVLDRLDEAYPGIRERLVQGDRMAPGMAVFVDGAIPTAGLRAKLTPEAEIYFAPAIAGGNPQPVAESTRSSGDKIIRAFAQAVSQEPGDLDAAKEHWSVRLLLQADRKAARPLRAAAPAREAPAAISPAPEHNVVGIGVGEKLVDRKHTGTLAVKFLVKLKYREGDIENKHRLPKSIRVVVR